jgi:hypothetical protein
VVEADNADDSWLVVDVCAALLEAWFSSVASRFVVLSARSSILYS